MDFVRGIHNIKSHHRGCILTIGNFDGFHRGHQSLILQLQTIGRARCLPIMVMIFEPQPQEYFLGKINCIRLTCLRDKIKYFSSFDIDVLLCISFNTKFKKITSCKFISDVLVKKLDIRLICVGDDFCFGACRQGNFTFLQKMGQKFNFEVIRVLTCTNTKGLRISSTSVRTALVNDDLKEAEILLGHSYSISGRVIYGNQFGRVLGFPTMNISLKGQRLAIHGVYAVEVYGILNTVLLGVANVGICPTVNGFTSISPRFEVHVLNKLMDFYGCYIRIVIRAKIRNECCFSSFEELKSQIKNDILSVKNYFKSLKNNCSFLIKL